MKKILLIATLIVLVPLCWYIFIRPYDFGVTFRVKTLPGTINQSIKTWNQSLNGSLITNQESLNSLEQQLKIGNKTYTYQWEIELVNDSTSKVQVYITEPGNSFTNKITIPFTETEIERNAEKTVKDFYKKIKEHLDNFRITVDGISEIERTYCVYIPLETTQFDKARGMMGNYSLLSSFITQNGIKTNGVPFIEVTKWNLEESKIQYNFCYPIEKSDSLPAHDFLKYKWLDHTKAIKATYYGNYITSDRAWYALMHYADQNNLVTISRPIEIFYNNPNLESNEKEWRAEIFLPIK